MKYPLVYFKMLFVGFLLILGHSMLRSFLPIFAGKLDPTGVLVGFTVSSYFFARTFIELPSGFISDRIGRRTPIVLGLCLSIIGSFTCVFSTSIYVLILGLTIWGLGAAFFFTNNMAFIIDLFEARVRGRAIGTFQGIEFIGSFAGAPIGGFLAEWLGYTSVFYVAGASIAMGFLVAFVSKGLAQIGARTKKSSTQMSFRGSLNGLKSSGLFATCVTSLSRMFIAQGVISTILPIYLHDFLNMSVGTIGVIFGIRTAAVCLATATCGYISDKTGRKPVIFAGILVESLCLILYTLTRSLEFLTILTFIEAFGAGMVSAALIALMSEQVASEYMGSAVGLFRTFLDAGAVIGPVLIVLILKAFTIYACFSFGAVLLLANIPILLIARERKKTSRFF